MRGDEFEEREYTDFDGQKHNVLYDTIINRPVLESGSELFVTERITEYTKNPNNWPRAEVEFMAPADLKLDKELFEKTLFQHPIYYPPGRKPLGLGKRFPIILYFIDIKLNKQNVILNMKVWR